MCVHNIEMSSVIYSWCSLGIIIAVNFQIVNFSQLAMDPYFVRAFHGLRVHVRFNFLYFIFIFFLYFIFIYFILFNIYIFFKSVHVACIIQLAS